MNGDEKRRKIESRYGGFCLDSIVAVRPLVGEARMSALEAFVKKDKLDREAGNVAWRQLGLLGPRYIMTGDDM